MIYNCNKVKENKKDRRINMKKKGFTLIELLAVIVVLAVIALIAVPLVTNVTKSSKEKAFEVKMYELVEASKTYYEELILDGEETEFIEGIDGIYSLTLDLSKQSDLEKLDVKRTFKKGLITITEEGKISITAIEDNICGQKLHSSETIKMLNIKEDFVHIYCLLLLV